MPFCVRQRTPGVSDGSEETDEEPDPATRKWDESEFLDDKYKEPEVDERFDIEPEIPEAPSPDDISPKVHTQFWSLVATFNIAILAVSVGGMLFLFQENTELGLQLFLVGIIVTAYGLYRYRTVKESLHDDQNG